MKKAELEKFAALYRKASEAGMAAGKAAQPVPMVVSEVSDPFASYALGVNVPPKAGGKSWYVSEGACGFAWVVIRPGNCPFANWLKKHGHAQPAYGGGVQIWISEHNQSVARKEAHAYAMADVFKEAGINAYADSRLD